MKFKNITLAVLMGTASFNISFAQNGSVVSAQIYQQDGLLDKAKDEIDSAVKNEKKSLDPKAWLTRGDIYTAIANNQVPAYEPIMAGSAKIAYDSYLKAIELENKPDGRTTKTAKSSLDLLWSPLINEGVKKYNEKAFKEAVEQYALAASLRPKDTTAYMYALFASESMKNEEGAKNALGYYDKLLTEFKLKRISYYYNSVYFINQYLKDDVLLENTLKKARTDFPDDGGLLTEQVNLYIKQKRDDECIALLQKEMAVKPNSAPLLFNLGTLLDQKGKNDEALEYYNKALTITPDAFDINYNVGANFYNRAVPIFNKVNQMKMDEYNKTGKKLESDGAELLKKALPYFEKAYSVKPDDFDIKKILKDSYYRLKMKDKADAIK